MEFIRLRLANGIKGIVASAGRSSPVSVQIWFFGGSRLEKEDKTSLAHLDEHMIFLRGGRDFPDPQSVEREFRLLGGSGNAMTSDEFTCYYLNTSPRLIRRAMHLLSDMVVNARLDSADLEKEKNAVIQELKRNIDDPEDYAERKFKEVIFGHHAFGRVDCDKIDILRRLTIDDVRVHKDRFYGPPNALVVVSGGIEFGDTAELVEEYFGTMPGVERAEFAPFVEDPALPPASVILRDSVEQAHLHIGGLAPSAKSTDLRPSSALHEIFSYRLFSKVRMEKGLAYSAFAEPRIFSDTGYSLAYAGIDPSQKVISEVVRIIFEEMADIKSGNIRDEEIEEAKALMHARLDLGLESSSMVGYFLATYELFAGGAKTPEEIHEETERITKDDITRLAREIWREESIRSLLLTTAFPGYEKVYTKFRRLLGS